MLLNCDWDQCCPTHEAPILLHRARTARPEMLISVILAKQGYEAWFLDAAESLRGSRGLPVDLQKPTDPASIRDAKGWLSQFMPRGQSYAETIDPAALTSQFDLELVRRADSFDKCYRDVRTMLETLHRRV